MFGRRIAGGVAAAAGFVYLASLLWLGLLDRSGPPHADLVLDGRVPATLHVPALPLAAGSEATSGRLPDPPPRGARPPAVVLVHGFAADRSAMSILARSLAESGYAALTIDLRGHGQNRRPFVEGRGTVDFLGDDIATAVAFLRTSPHVDGLRISLVGHSMGASAVLQYASRDPSIDGVVLISGGRRVTGPYRPPNSLFVVAGLDPSRIRERSASLAASLAGEPVEAARIYGDFRQMNAVSWVDVPGADHATVVASSAAVLQIVAWLDRIDGRDRRAFMLRTDPRLEAALGLGLAFLLLLPAVGVAAAHLTPRRDAAEAGSTVVGLVVLACALGITLPLFIVGSPLPVVGLEIADVVVPHLAVAGLLLLALLQARGHLAAAIAGSWRPAILAAFAAMLSVGLLLTPLGVVFHRLTLTPERFLAASICFVLLVPFALAFNVLLRRGSPLRASISVLLGRAVVVLTLVVGVRLGITSGVVLLMLPMLVVLFIVLEGVAGSMYATSRDRLSPALLEAAWIAWIFAAVLPIRF